MTKPFNCPFCGHEPKIYPGELEKSGNCYGSVRCENIDCPAKPRVEDGINVSDDRGSDAYKEAAILRWNNRATASIYEPKHSDLMKKLYDQQMDDEERVTRVWGIDGPMEITESSDIGWVTISLACRHDLNNSAIVNIDEGILPVLLESLQRVHDSFLRKSKCDERGGSGR